MKVDNLKVTFTLEGDGIIYDKFNPIHLDSIIDKALSPMNRRVKHLVDSGENPEEYGVTPCQDLNDKIPVPSRTDKPFEFKLPIWSSNIKGERIYHASALFPQGGEVETIQYFRTKFPQEFITDCIGSANLQSGLTRDHNTPYTVTLCRDMVGYAVGNFKQLRKVFYRTHSQGGEPLPEKRLMILALGKKRNRGLGGLVDITVEKVDYDWSIIKEGKAQRYLPDDDGMRECRVRPPYWNIHGAIPCCDVGDEYSL